MAQYIPVYDIKTCQEIHTSQKLSEEEWLIETLESNPDTKYRVFSWSLKTKTKLRGRSPQANYTDRATEACRRS
jgi:hypothetical protein